MANEFLSARVRVKEKRAGTPQIRGTAQNVGCMVGRTLRGPAGKAVRITSFPQYERIFGGNTNDSYIPESVNAFFKNGGAAMYLIRALGSSGGANVKAALTLSTAGGGATAGSLTSGASAFPVALATADTFVGAVDGGAPATLTITAVAASKTGAAATYAATTIGDVLKITIPGILGGAEQTVTFAGTENTQALWHAAINDQIVGGSVVNSGGQTKIQTDKKGTGASGSIGAGSTGAVLTSLGLTSGAFTAGTGNVIDVSAVTAAEFAALLTATFAGSTGSAPTSTSVTWTSSTTGASSSVKFNSGLGVAKVTGFDTVIHSGAASSSQNSMVVTAKGEGLDSNNFVCQVASNDAKIATTIPSLVSSGSITQLSVSASVASRLQPGDTIKLYDATTGPTTARGIVKQVKNNIVIFTAAVTLSGNLTAANTSITIETFTFTMSYDGSVVQGPTSALRVSPLSAKNYFYNVLNIDDDELVVSVADSAAALSANLDIRPANTLSTGDALTGGDEHTTFADADYIGDEGNATGFYAINKKKDARLMAVPGVSGITVTGAISKALVEFCETKETILAIVAPPQGTAVTAAVDYKKDSVGSSSYGAIYYPWVQIVGPLTGVKQSSPPEGYVMGMIAKSGLERGIQKAPAGEDTGKLVGVVGVERVLGEDDADLLYPENLNPIMDIEDVGQCVMGARTLEKGTEFEGIHIRQTFIYLKTSLQLGTRFVLFEENTPETRAKVDRAMSGFLEKEWRLGTLTGAKIDDAFTVTCDSSNNPVVLVKQKLMVADAIVNIPETTEGLLITIQQTQGGSASVAA